MASGRFSKQAIYLGSRLLNNNNANDSVIGGALTTAPAGFTPASQFQQTLPGDRIILSPTDALALSNNNVGNLYTGTYRYVAMRNNSSSSPGRGHAAFWDASANGTGNNISSTAADALYQVTSDEAANVGVSLFAGVYINNVSVNNNNNFYWWIQESGKASCKFRTVVSANAAIGGGVYVYGGGNNNNAADVGSFDMGSNNAANQTYFQLAVDQMMVRYVGVAETLPSNNNISLVDLTLSRASFRW